VVVLGCGDGGGCEVDDVDDVDGGGVTCGRFVVVVPHGLEDDDTEDGVYGGIDRM